MKKRWIPCRVRPGVFRDEYIVSVRVVRHADGNGEMDTMEFVADRRGVKIVKEPSHSQDGEGQFLVWEHSRDKERLRVIIPGSGASDSAIVTVPEDVVLT